MLIPRPVQLKDGGTIEYKAILYKVVKVHSLTGSDDLENGYNYYKGYRIEILGFKVFDNVELVKE